jgi:RNA polymerase sigma-70 factor (ECF subfamily)
VSDSLAAYPGEGNAEDHPSVRQTLKPTMPATPEPISSAGAFATTHWTRVLAARGESVEARQALSELCAAYYQPVYRFLQREGRSEDTARELTHAFFARVLEHQSLDGANPQRGRFRSYLLGAVKHFLANRQSFEHREKRGGGAAHEPLLPSTDSSPGLDVADPNALPPDAAFDREWAVTVLKRAFAVLASENDTAGNRHEYETLKPWLSGEWTAVSQADAARKLDLTENAVRVAIHRLRRRFRQIVKAEIARTVNDPSEIADELRHLIAILA